MRARERAKDQDEKEAFEVRLKGREERLTKTVAEPRISERARKAEEEADKKRATTRDEMFEQVLLLCQPSLCELFRSGYYTLHH